MLKNFFRRCLYIIDRNIRRSLNECACPVKGGSIQFGHNIWAYSQNKCLCHCTCPNGQLSNRFSNGKCACCSDGSVKDIFNIFDSCKCQCPDGFVSHIEYGRCKCETCQVCSDGSIAKRTDNDHCGCNSECGIQGTCLHTRSGPNCDRPVCHPSYNCSGNGDCVALSKCRSFCRCFQRWTGDACETLIPRNTWGDPHLETFDGRNFDYFGIGQFWGCISKYLSYQFRFFGNGRTSFIGGISIRIDKENILTIYTKQNVEIFETAKIRLNGEQMDFRVNKSSSIFFQNRTIRVDISTKQNNSLIQDNPNIGNILIQFKNIASITVHVSYSQKMRRQFLGISTTATNVMFYQTKGLCGFFNNDDSDDFTGPNGEIFSSHIDFVESWRLNDTVRFNGSLKNTWSWNFSNFHIDDKFDFSYSNPEHNPVYSISDFPKEIVELANRSCSNEKLSKREKEQCITDVVLTNDTTISKQGPLELRQCENNCLNRGYCIKGECECLDGWSGKFCQWSDCGTCVYGNCSNGFCECFKGYVGEICDKNAICENNCSSNGFCIRNDLCECNTGWTSSSYCSKKAVCSHGCSKRGVCKEDNLCSCDFGFNETDCSGYSCEKVNFCSKNGLCVGYDRCQCFDGWFGDSCSIPFCKNDCSGNGQCIEPFTCECLIGFEGEDCSLLKSCPQMNNCNKHGICKNETFCICDEGFKGSTCNEPICIPECSANGKCKNPNECECNFGYTGPTCLNFSCESLSYCSRNGLCKEENTCNCFENWFGKDCSQANCVSKCSSNGDCIGPNTCSCFEGYEGKDCSMKSAYNNDAPVFLNDNYTFSTHNQIDKGEFIGKVTANDSDSGSSGEISYSILTNSSPLRIDTKFGRIFSSGKLKPGVHNLWVTARDNGFPILTSKVNVTLNVCDLKNSQFIVYPKDRSTFRLSSSTTKGFHFLTIRTSGFEQSLKNNASFTINCVDSLHIDIFEVKYGTNRIVTVKSPLPIGSFQCGIIVINNSFNTCPSSSKFYINIFKGVDENPIKNLTTKKSYTEKEIRKTNLITMKQSTIEQSTLKSFTDSTEKISDLKRIDDKIITAIICISLSIPIIIILITIFIIISRNRNHLIHVNLKN